MFILRIMSDFDWCVRAHHPSGVLPLLTYRLRVCLFFRIVCSKPSITNLRIHSRKRTVPSAALSISIHRALTKHGEGVSLRCWCSWSPSPWIRLVGLAERVVLPPAGSDTQSSFYIAPVHFPRFHRSLRCFFEPEWNCISQSRFHHCSCGYDDGTIGQQKSWLTKLQLGIKR
jgi:hypothetical protein